MARKKASFDELKAIMDEAKATDYKHIDRAAHHLVSFFMKMQDRLNSEDEKERAGALQDLETLQKELDAYANEAVAKSGMSPNQLHQYMHNKENFSEEEWEKLQKAEAELKDYEQELIRSTRGVKGDARKASSQTTKKGKKIPKRPPRSDWLSG